MKRLKKLLASTLIVSSILVISSIGSFAETNNVPNIAQQQFSTLAVLPQGLITGDITIGQDIIAWDGSYNSYQVSIREWSSLASFQSNPTSGGTTGSYTSYDNSYNYDFVSGRVYRVYVYGIDAGVKFTIGGYEWQE